MEVQCNNCGHTWDDLRVKRCPFCESLDVDSIGFKTDDERQLFDDIIEEDLNVQEGHREGI